MLLTWVVVSSPIMAQTSNDPNNGGGSPVGLQSVADAVYDGYNTAMGKMSDVFSKYFDQKSPSFASFQNWIGVHNFWALVTVNETTDPVSGQTLPVSNLYNLQVQAAQNANFNASVEPETFTSMNDLVQLLMVGVVFPLTNGDKTSDNIVSYKTLDDNTIMTDKCSSDWEKRFSADEYDILCDSSNQYQDNVNTILTVIRRNIKDVDFYRRLIFYYNQVQNCQDSITSLQNVSNNSSSSSSSSIGGQTIPDPSSVTSGSSGIPLVQCYFDLPSGNELANNIYNDLTSACGSLSGTLKDSCQDLREGFKDYASDASTSLSGISYSATSDNGVSANYGPVVSKMISKLKTTLTDVQQVVYSDVFNSKELMSMPLMESIYPSMDNVILPSQYGIQRCDPTKADQDKNFVYFSETDNTSVNYAYYYIVGLDQTVPKGLSMSEATDMSDMDGSTSMKPIYIHGGRFIYCNKNNTDSNIYKSLCQDENDNDYTTDLSSIRSGLMSQISNTRDQLTTSANVYLAQRSAAFSNLWDMYNRRALVGDVSGCTPNQIATYHATWRYTSPAKGEPSWQEKIRSSEDLTQMDLMREAVLLLQDINFQLHQLNQTSERSMSIETIVALNQLSTQTIMNGSTMMTGSIGQFNTGHNSTTSAAASGDTSSLPTS